MGAKTCWTCGASILPGDAEARDEGRLASDCVKAAEDMRERAAKAVETFIPNIRRGSDEQAIREQFRHQAATVIRALDTGET